MRFSTLLIAAFTGLAGIAAATPASAERAAATTRVAIATPAGGVAVTPGTGQTADQYRYRRYGYRPGYRRYNRGGYRRYGYRPYRARPYYRSYRGWRGRGGCRTVWRYGRPFRRCW